MSQTLFAGMSRREQGVVSLLRTLYAWCPGPKIAARSGAVVGESAVKRSECPACGGTGKRRIRGVLQRCDRCQGRKAILVDPQTHHEVIAAERASSLAQELEDHFAQIANAPADERGLHRLRERDRGWELAGRADGAEDEPGDMLTRAHEARESQYAEGDYAALERRLTELRRLNLRRHSHLLVCYVPECHPEIFRLSEEQRADAAFGVRWLAGQEGRFLLSEPLRVPGWARDPGTEGKDSLWRGRTAKHVEQREDRDGRIVQCYFGGESPVQLAERFHLHERRVRQIVASAAGFQVPVLADELDEADYRPGEGGLGSAA